MYMDNGVLMSVVSHLQIPFQTIEGLVTNLAAFTGKVVLVVNTASKCGYTPQYAGLQSLYETYRDRGFVVLGFPSNNFFWQEPGSNAKILKFCTTEYGVMFPMMSKVSVRGRNQHPLFAYLTKESPLPGAVEWNFSKFLLDRQGNVVARYGSKVWPDDEVLIAAIEKLLAE
jgi:glutathione peroxidase